jgi:acetate kinase
VTTLVLNPGSASLKFQVVQKKPGDREGAWGLKLISGTIEPVQQPGTFTATDRGGGTVVSQAVPAGDHGAAAKLVLESIGKGVFSSSGVESLSGLDLIACRVVHGGARFYDPVEVDHAVISGIESLDDLAPLHNASSVAILREARAATRGTPPLAAVFDSAFHRTLPEVAWRYPIPYDLAEKHGIRRFGFHGISHKYLMLRYAQLRGVHPHRVNIVTLHLEGGSSAAAIKNGVSVDTSMGLTPLEGLMMATRCGDIDPALPGILARKENTTVAEVERLLNRKSGLLGISGHSPDTRVLVHDSEPRSQLALDMFAYRVRKYIGAYVAAMGGADAIVFGGGIGENTPDVRRRICAGLESLGLSLDPEVNTRTIDREGRITSETSRLHAFVIPTEEGLMMAHDAAELAGVRAS